MPPTLANGAERSQLERLKAIEARTGMAGDVACFASDFELSKAISYLRSLDWEVPIGGERTYRLLGVPVTVHTETDWDRNQFEERSRLLPWLESFPDGRDNRYLINATDFSLLPAALRRWPDQTAVLFTDERFPRPMDLESTPLFAPLLEAYRSIRHPVVASTAMKLLLHKSWGLSARVVRNPLTLKIDGDGRRGEAIGMVNPIPVKGSDLFLSIARALPHERFIAVGGWGPEIDQFRRAIEPMSNVEYWPPMGRLDRFWNELKVLIVPSVWHEAFGRVVLEAMAASVPVLAAAVGALPETVGNGGLLLPVAPLRHGKIPADQPVSEWIAAVRSLDEKRLSELTRRGRERVDAYSREVEESLHAWVEFFR